METATNSKRSRLFYYCLIFSFVSFGCVGQSSYCPNTDFENGDFSNWSGSIGRCCPTTTPTPGLVAGRHTIISTPGLDPNTCNKLQIKPAYAGNYICRLGNDNTGAQAEQLVYKLLVDTNNALFVYRYAVVLEDPGHSIADQPKFRIRVLDQNGKVTDPACGEYFVQASANIPGFQTCSSFGSTIVWKDWTTVGVDLSKFMGQTVQMEFTTSDCGLGAHFGYAYLDCFCMPLKIQSEYCIGKNQILLTAPPYFAGYSWSTGATTQSITINNPTLGQQVSCTMKTVTSCDLKITTVLQQTYVTAAFTYDTTKCSKAVHFENISTVVNGTLASWNWDFGDGSGDVNTHPTHTYTTDGTYLVKLIAYSIIGCTDTVSLPVRAYTPPVPLFDSVTACENQELHFIDRSTQGSGSIISWNWDFNDGTFSSTQSPPHSFSTAGTYNVSLSISSSIGCNESVTHPITVYSVPVADFSFNSGPCSKEYSFTDLSNISSGNLTGWQWNFGDGTISNSQNVNHAFPDFSSYHISLTAASDYCAQNISKTINIQAPPEAIFATASNCFGSTTTFQDQSTGFISNWDWDFGDNAFANTQFTQHQYADTGKYIVSLIVSNTDQCADTLITPVVIHPLPVSDFHVVDSVCCMPMCSEFKDQSTIFSGLIKKYQWNFGDGGTSDLTNPLHCYNSPGNYTVQLTVASDFDCVHSSSRKNLMTVYPAAIADFSMNPSHADVDHPVVTFSDHSINTVSWQWDFGDNFGISRMTDPVYEYSRWGGTYNVKLIVISNDGCPDTVIKPVKIHEVFAFYVPNAFTANKDGLNENFSGYGMGISKYRMLIYNRWGQIVFETEDLHAKWDGKVGDTHAQQETYVWKVDLRDMDEQPHNYVGTVTVTY